MGEHFGIGFAGEGVAFGEQFGAQRGVILDDAVMDDGEPAAAIHGGCALASDGRPCVAQRV